jgi:hypothetical protein
MSLELLSTNSSDTMRMKQLKNTYNLLTWEVWHKQAVCWRGRAINVCVLDSIDSLKIVLFWPMELSSLTTVVVAATETCRNVAWLYKHLCRMLGEFEVNNLMDFLIFCLFLCLFVLIKNREYYHCDYLTEVIYFVFGMPWF